MNVENLRYMENKKLPKGYSIELSQCLECEDKPITVNLVYKNDILYTTDMRPEEYTDLEDKISQCLDYIRK